MPDKAIVVGIGHYPTLGRKGTAANDLPGAIRDADEMAEWLANTGAEVIKITSTGFNDRPYDVARIRPVLQDIHDAFLPIVTAPNRQGDRLYVYMAGHGIAPEPRSRCLILADAVASVTPWVPNCEAPAWIDWFAGQTQYDQFVLWMDCCGTRGLEYVRGRPFVATTATRPEDDASVFMAFASGNGRAAYEGPTEDGVVRGFFTNRLLKGLRGGAVNIAGQVRSGSLANYLRNGSAQSSDGKTSSKPKRPEPMVPHEQDMLFATVAMPAYEIEIRNSHGAAPDGTQIVATRPGEPFSQTRSVTGGWATFNLPVGVVKLDGPDILRLVDIGAATPSRIEWR